MHDDDDVYYYYIRWRLELEGETENTGISWLRFITVQVGFAEKK